MNVVADAMSRVSVFCSQFGETEHDTIDEEKNKKYTTGNINFILIELHDKMGLPGRTRIVEFIQRNFDEPSLKQNVEDYISKYFVCLELKPMLFKPPYTPFIIRSKQLGRDCR